MSGDRGAQENAPLLVRRDAGAPSLSVDLSHINGGDAGTHPSSGWFAHDHPQGDDSNEGVGQTRLERPG